MTKESAETDAFIEKQTLASQIMRASEGEPPVLAKVANTLKPLAKPLGFIARLLIDYIGPFYLKLGNLGFELYQRLPKEAIQTLAGLALTFCGGGYTASISAVKAFQVCGWDRTEAALIDIGKDVQAVWAANVSDSKKHDDAAHLEKGDIDSNELLSRKLAVSAQAVKDPEKLSAALGGLMTSWIAVQGMLRIEFAKTIALGISISGMIAPLAQKVAVPFLVHTLPKEYHNWIQFLIKNASRSIGCFIAWKLQEVVSAAHLAMVGGLMFARGLMAWVRNKGYTSIPDEADTKLDEVVGYSIAGLGFYSQLKYGFSLPFPLNWIFFPLDIVEWYIRWTLTS